MADVQSELLKEKLDQVNRTMKRDRFLNLVSTLESSNGQNTEHPLMSEGIHSGDRALGQYGLMPKTIEEVQARQEKRQPQNNEALTEVDPETEEKVAKYLANRVLDKYPSEDMAAYAWNHGHNLSPEEIEKRDYLHSDYVKKFQGLKKKLGY